MVGSTAKTGEPLENAVHRANEAVATGFFGCCVSAERRNEELVLAVGLVFLPAPGHPHFADGGDGDGENVVTGETGTGGGLDLNVTDSEG